MKMLIAISVLIFGLLPTSSFAKQSYQLSVNNQNLKAKADKYYYYNFGHVKVNFRERLNLSLKNTGDEDLNIRAIYISGNSYWAYSNCPNMLPPNQVCYTWVDFKPWHEGFFSGRLRFAFTEDNIVVDLSGWGIR